LLGVSHLDAAQGSQEEQTSRTNGTGSERQTPADTAMRQKACQCGQHCWSAGQGGAKDPGRPYGDFGSPCYRAFGAGYGDYTKRAQEFSKLDKTYEVIMKLGETSFLPATQKEKFHHMCRLLLKGRQSRPLQKALAHCCVKIYAPQSMYLFVHLLPVLNLSLHCTQAQTVKTTAVQL